MKNRLLFTLIFFFVLCLATPLRAQSVVLRLQGGSEQTIPLNSLQKITFSGNNLVLNYSAGGTQSYGFSNLEKLFFSQISSISKSTFPTLDIYFNATDNQVYYKNLPDFFNRLSIYRLDGVPIYSATVSDCGSVDMSRFPAGIYIIRANNKVMKFKK